MFAVVGEGNEDAVEKLFQTSGYNLTGYISSYIKELQGQYYTERWYIYKHDSGSEVNVNIVHLAMRDMVMPDGKKHGTFIPVVKNVKPMRRFHVINPFLRMRTRK